MARIAIDARKIRDFGIGSHVRNLLAGLARIAPDHDFLLFLPPREPMPVAGGRFTRLETGAPGYAIAEHLSLPLAALRAGARLFHAPHYVLPLAWPRPAVVTIHDLIHLRFPEYLPNGAALHYARYMMRSAYRRAARVLTVSESTKRDLLDAFGGDPARIVVVPNTIDEMFLQPVAEETLVRVRERWRLPARFLLYAGNIKPHKNLERLVRAFAALRADAGIGDLKLVLIGNELARYHVLRRLAAELRVVEHVRFLAWLPREELAATYRLAHVFAYPSLYEGFGLPPLEAMACGVPVVVSKTSSLPEVCGEAAVYIDPLDVNSLTEGLRAAIADEDLRARLGTLGRERARRLRQHDPAAAILATYDEVLRGGA